MAELVEAGDRNADPVQALAQLQADGPQPDDRHGLGQVRQLEDPIGGDDALAQGLPGRGDQGSGSGGDDHAGGADALRGGLDQCRLDEVGILLDELVAQIIGAVAEHPIDEGIAQVLDVLHDITQVQGQFLMPVHPVAAQGGTAVVILGDLDQGLGRHATDPGTGSPGLAAVDEGKGTAGPAGLAHGVEPGSAGSNDGDIHGSFLHGFLQIWEIRVLQPGCVTADIGAAWGE